MTTKQVVEAIRANVDRWQERAVTFEEFEAEQFRLWDYAASRSQRFSDIVAQTLCPFRLGV